MKLRGEKAIVFEKSQGKFSLRKDEKLIVHQVG